MSRDADIVPVPINRLVASCSSCGHILGRALSGSDNEVDCPKCGAKINYKIVENKVTVTLISPSRKKPSTNKGLGGKCEPQIKRREAVNQ